MHPFWLKIFVYSNESSKITKWYSDKQTQLDNIQQTTKTFLLSFFVVVLFLVYFKLMCFVHWNSRDQISQADDRWTEISGIIEQLNATWGAIVWGAWEGHLNAKCIDQSCFMRSWRFPVVSAGKPHVGWRLSRKAKKKQLSSAFSHDRDTKGHRMDSGGNQWFWSGFSLLCQAATGRRAGARQARAGVARAGGSEKRKLPVRHHCSNCV